MKDDIENIISTFTGNKDKDVEMLKKVVQNRYDYDRRFEEWARRNAVRFDEQ